MNNINTIYCEKIEFSYSSQELYDWIKIYDMGDMIGY